MITIRHPMHNFIKFSHKQAITNSLALSVFTAVFPGETGLASFIGAKDDENGGNNWSYKTCKAPVKSSPPTNWHPVFYRPAAFPVIQPKASENWKEMSRDSPWR